MRTPANVKRHPIHPMLIVFPLGLWVFSFICQLVSLWSVNPNWHTAALYCAGGGVIGALVAAIPGFVDLFSIRDRQAKRTGLTHMTLNLIAVVIWAIDYALLRSASYGAAFVIAIVGLVDIIFSGWLGGSLVYRHGVAVTTTGPAAATETIERRAAGQ